MEETLGKRISAGRKRLGITQDKLAETLGVTAQAVSKWENDQSCPDIAMLPKLASLFGTSVDALLGVAAVEAVQGEVITEEPEDQGGNHWEFHWDAGRKPRIWFAVWVLMMGLLLLYPHLFDAKWDSAFWPLAWPSALLLFGLSGLYPRFSFFRLGCALLGGYFLLEHLQITVLGLSPEVLMIIALLLFGVSLLADALRRPKKAQVRISGKGKRFCRDYSCTEDTFTSNVSFGEDTHLVALSALDRGDINVSFGDLTVDLSQVESLKSNCHIDANCSFGELTIRVPSRFRVNLDQHASFATVNLQGQCRPDASDTLTLTAGASFGEITVMYI